MKRYNYRLGGGSRIGEPYLIVTRHPFPEIHWQVPYAAVHFWVRQLLDLTDWHDPAQFEALVQAMKEFEL